MQDSLTTYQNIWIFFKSKFLIIKKIADFLENN
jgi:hypothetical protein